MPMVYNLRKQKILMPDDAVLVDRSTPYGNPFRERVWGRAKCLELYREWIMLPEQAELRARMQRELCGKDLVCWCAPLPCHADIILKIANAQD